MCSLSRKLRRIDAPRRSNTPLRILSTRRSILASIFPARIAFRTITSVDSKVVLGKKGAEALTGKGDMLFFAGENTIRAQCAYTSTEFVKHESDVLLARYRYQMPERIFKLPKVLTEEEIDKIPRQGNWNDYLFGSRKISDQFSLLMQFGGLEYQAKAEKMRRERLDYLHVHDPELAKFFDQ